VLSPDQIHPGYQDYIKPTSLVAEGILAKAGFTASAHVHERCGHLLLSPEEARDFLLRHYEHQVHPYLQQAKPRRSDPRTNPSTKTKPDPAQNRRTGRPKKDQALPSVHGNRKLEKLLHNIGLTKTEKQCARNILSALRSHFIRYNKGAALKRSNLGSRSVVARTMKKLRDAQLITETHRIAKHGHGNAAAGITNLGHAFLQINKRKSAHSEPAQPATNTPERGSSSEPALREFRPHQTPCKYRLLPRILNPRFRYPLKRVSRQPLSLASAPLRAAAIEHGQSMQQSDQSNQSMQSVESMPAERLINGLSNPLNLTNGDQVKYKDQISTVVAFCWESEQYLIRIVESGDTVRCAASQLGSIS